MIFLGRQNKGWKGIALVAALVVAGAGLFLPLAHAAVAPATISPYIPGAGTVPTSGSPGAWLANVYDYAFFLGGILAFGAIAYGGIRYALSAGNPSGLKDAREWVQSALLGLLLLAAAYLILYTVNPAIVNLSFDVPSISSPLAPACRLPCGNGCCSAGQGCSTSNTCVSLSAPPGNSCPTPLCGGACCSSGKCIVNIQNNTQYCG